MKYLFKLFIVFIIFVVKFQFIAFSQGDVSGNGLYVASMINENTSNVVCVHRFMTKELFRKIEVPTNESVDDLKFSFSGKYLSAQKGATFYIIDIVQGKIISTIYDAEQVEFSKNDDFFIVLKSNKILKYKSSTGKLEISMSYPAKKVQKLVLSPNDEIFIAQAVDRIYVYTLDNKIIKKTFAGVDVKFRDDGKFFTVLTIVSADKVRVSTYESSTLYSKKVLNSNLFLDKKNPKGNLLTSRCSLSDEGKYVALYTANNYQVEIYVYDTWNYKLLWIINNLANSNNDLFPHYWPNPFTLVAYGENLMAGKYNIINRQTTTLGLRIDNFNINDDTKKSKQLKNRLISPDYNFVAIQSGTDLFIRDTRLPNKKATLKNVEFVAYSPDSKYLFVKKNNVVNVVVLSQLTSSLQANVPVKFYVFDRKSSTVVKESEIQNDAKPPKGYAFFYVNNTKQIVKVDTAKLHYVFRSINLNSNEVELQINLVDANGNQFIGATDASWKYIWCNLLIQNPNGDVTQINDFSVEEKNDISQTAYALVLDHSGSMGTKRANSLQYGAWDLVNNKRPQDAFMLIKYDNHVKLESHLTKEKYIIQRKLNNTGITGFGGGTALVDATYLAVKKLADASEYSNKVIILFTDGNENASFYNKFDLLSAAKKNGIQINVVGFGNEINEKYLKSIAYNTGGLYVHLYKTKELRSVFKDIDFKRKNYYSVKFKTQVQGKHIAFLQLCQDLFKHDSIWIPFDNSDQRKQIDKLNPIIPLQPKTVRLTYFNKLKIPINPTMKPVKSTKINQDFSNINFPNILFATASDLIVKSEKEGIDEIVKFMRKYPYVFLEIHGHTDNQGTVDFNLDLSKRRALAAKKLIVKGGIAPGRIITRGYGDTKPITSNDTEQGKAKNRRIEFYIFTQK